MCSYGYEAYENSSTSCYGQQGFCFNLKLEQLDVKMTFLHWMNNFIRRNRGDLLLLVIM